MRQIAAIALGVTLLPGLPAPAPSATITPVGVVRYQFDDKSIRVRARVNGSQPFWFAVDSGARHTVIDTSVAKGLGLRIAGLEQMRGVGKGTVPMQHAVPADISINTVHLRVADPWVIDLHGSEGAPVDDGLIGADFFKAFIVQVDPVRQTIAFYDPSTFRYEGVGAAIPLSAPDNRLFIALKLTLGNGISAVHRVRIDTGSGDAVADDLVRQSPQRRRARQGVGLGQSYIDYSGVIKTVQIGPYVIHDAWGPSQSAPEVGMEILRRFTMTFDVPHGHLYLQPNLHLRDPVPSPAPG